MRFHCRGRGAAYAPDDTNWPRKYSGNAVVASEDAIVCFWRDIEVEIDADCFLWLIDDDPADEIAHVAKSRIVCVPILDPRPLSARRDQKDFRFRFLSL